MYLLTILIFSLAEQKQRFDNLLFNMMRLGVLVIYSLSQIALAVHYLDASS